VTRQKYILSTVITTTDIRNIFPVIHVTVQESAHPVKVIRADDTKQESR